MCRHSMFTMGFTIAQRWTITSTTFTTTTTIIRVTTTSATTARRGRAQGQEPIVFKGDCSKTEEFLTQWELYSGVNYAHSAMQMPFTRAMLFLTYIQGAQVNEWVAAQSTRLIGDVAHRGVPATTDCTMDGSQRRIQTRIRRYNGTRASAGHSEKRVVHEWNGC
jgi:hypothetical protein